MKCVEINKDHNGSWLCIVKGIDDELKDEIRERLTSICYGTTKRHKHKKIYSYKETLKEFLRRYDTKTSEIKKGMIGELLSHILILHCDKELKTLTPFFNIEERSIKKGFDAVLFKNRDVWYSEVKAGNANELKTCEKNKILLNNAKRDINAKLSRNRTALWISAIAGVRFAISNSSIEEVVEGILEDNLAKAQNGSVITKKVILISVTYKTINDQLLLEEVSKIYANISKEMIFDDMIIISIQKGTYHKIEEFLKAEVNNE